MNGDSSVEDEADLIRLAEACAWRSALQEADTRSAPGFEAWLAADSRNPAAWAATAGPLDFLDAQAAAPELLSLREDVIARARRRRALRYAVRTPWARLAAGLAAVVILASSLLAGVWWATKPTTYATALGERRVITLADGSRVALDSGSLLKVRLTAEARRLDLIRGQARFDVAHDVARPFTVHARDQLVVATGTSFNVDLLGPKVLVTLLEGRVSVLKDPPRLLPAMIRPIDVASPKQVVAKLAPGDQLIATAPEGPEVAEPPVRRQRLAAAGLERAVAWESGQLVFEDESLGAVAERIARYSPRVLRVEGAAANLKISGVFSAGDVTTFIDAVQRGLPVEATTSEDDAIVIRMRAP